MLGKKKNKKKGKAEAEEIEEEVEETGEEETKGKKGKKKGKKKKGKKKKLLLILVILLLAGGAAAFFFLRGRGDGGEKKPEEPEPEQPIETPAVYTFGETTIPALPVLSEEVLVYSPEPPEPAEGEEAVTAVTYRYEGYTDPRGMLAGYAGLLTAADIGFVYVDDTLTTTEAPDYEAETGTATLAKSVAGDEETVMSIQLEWTAEIGTLVTDTMAGRIRSPRPDTMTLLEAEDYVRGMNPADLGLSGETMDEYNIYPLAGSVLVDGNLCLHISVYSVDESSGANEIAGEYFIAADKSHIYRRDAVSGKVSEVG